MALAAVLENARNEGVENLLVAGDLCGYYYHVAEVLELLDDFHWQCVQGNHEAMFGSLMDGADPAPIRRKYGSALELAVEQLPHSAAQRLLDLGHPLACEFEGRRILLCHGSPMDRDRYVYPDPGPQAVEDTSMKGFDLVVYGHTHYPVVWEGPETLVVNPGSVGQPRDQIPGACWAIYDTARHLVSLRRESYDSLALLQECRERDPALPYLHQVLVRTR
jgi:predicted phosphodiesterase